MRPGAAGALAALLSFPSMVVGQASRYVAPDDPRLPLFEHLAARGEVRDPSPLVRPLRRGDLAAALAAAAPASAASTALVASLKAWYAMPGWSVAGRAGGQSYSHARRDLLQPGGPGGTDPYAELAAAFETRLAAGASRLAWEPRLENDPDWRDTTAADPRDGSLRLINTYLALQTAHFGVMYGTLDRTWGPATVGGLPVSTDGYAPPLLAFDGRVGRFSAMAMGGELRGVANPVIAGVHRRFTARRLDVRIGKEAHLGLWETGVSSTDRTGVLATLADPFRPLLVERLFANPDDRNLLLGADLSWRVHRALLLETQVALDDVGSEGAPDDAERPARWGGALGLAGPLGAALSWRARVAAGSSLLYRTPRPEEYYTNGGVGVGRNNADNVVATLSLGIPMRAAWLVSPEVTWQRQGEGVLTAPFPEGTDLAATPVFFIGTPSTLWRLGAGLAGQEGIVGLQGFAGLQHVRNADHVPGETRTRFEGRIQATVGFSLGGSWQ